jgi:hypothetical protein
MSQNLAPRSFFQHKRVWVVFIVTFTLAFCISRQIIVADNLQYAENFGEESAQLFMDSFKLPIRIVAAGLSVLLLFATQHRSEQTAEQIKLTNQANENSLSQNTLRNYYDSIADFEKYINESYHSEVLEIKNKRLLYKRFFPNNSYKSVSPYTTKEAYENNVTYFLNQVNNLIKDCREKYEDEAVMFQNIILNFISSTKINYGVDISTKAFQTNSPVEDFLEITMEVRKLLTFCMEYTPSNGVIVIVNSTVHYLDEWKAIEDNGSTIRLLKYVTTMKNGVIRLRNPKETLFNNKD